MNARILRYSNLEAQLGMNRVTIWPKTRTDLRQIIRRQRAMEATVDPAQVVVTNQSAVDRAQARERLQQMRDELAKKARTPAMPRGKA